MVELLLFSLLVSGSENFLNLFAISLSLLLAIPFLLIWLLVKCTSRGPAIYWSQRVGKNNKIFLMPKFRTMLVDTPQVATHLMTKSDNYLTSVGPFLRKTSLDEIPQLWSIIKGDMSFVGPRPALFNQDDLIELRTKRGVHLITPGLTGWAQINGRDEIPIPKKVELDFFYKEKMSFLLDLKIIALTFVKAFIGRDVSH